MSITEGKSVLAIDPTSRGFGYAFFEGQSNLVDWGTKQIEGKTGETKNIRCILKIRELIQHFQPDVIVLEDPRGEGSRRCARICRLIASIRALAAKNRVMTRCFSRSRVREIVARYNARTKYQIAVKIAKELPELEPHLPRRRKLWMSEDERMAVFDAAAFALVYYKPTSFIGKSGKHSLKAPLEPMSQNEENQR